jgi:hypothetical protein
MLHSTQVQSSDGIWLGRASVASGGMGEVSGEEIEVLVQQVCGCHHIKYA